MADEGAKPRGRTIQSALTLVFALGVIVPLLFFAHSLHRLDALDKPEHQLALGVSLLVGVMGFYLFRRLVSHMSRLVTTAARASMQVRASMRGGVPFSTSTSGPTTLDSDPVVVGTAEAEVHAGPEDLTVPGLGVIHELNEMADLVSDLWKTEAERNLNRRVRIVVRNARVPLTGTLCEVSEDGVILEENGQQQGVSYRRILGIEPASR